MALNPRCRDCTEFISPNALSCPHCGSTLPFECSNCGRGLPGPVRANTETKARQFTMGSSDYGYETGTEYISHKEVVELCASCRRMQAEGDQEGFEDAWLMRFVEEEEG